MSARIRRARGYLQYVRERGYLLEAGRFVLTTQRQLQRADENAFEIGRDYQRGESRKWSAIRETLQPLIDASMVEHPERDQRG